MVIRVSRYVAIITPNGGGSQPAIEPFNPGDFFTSSVPGYWMGRLTVEAAFDLSQLFGDGQAGMWLGGAAPASEVPL